MSILSQCCHQLARPQTHTNQHKHDNNLPATVDSPVSHYVKACCCQIQPFCPSRYIMTSTATSSFPGVLSSPSSESPSHALSTADGSGAEVTSSSAKSHTQPKTKKKRNVLLDAESEKLLQQQEREEFHKVIEEQYSHIDVKELGTLPECQGVPHMFLANDGSWIYWMSVMLQYQSMRSYAHYSTDQDKQQKQLEWQKEMRFQLMQKKRAIKREKRKLLKLQTQLSKKGGGSTRRKRTLSASSNRSSTGGQEADDEQLAMNNHRHSTSTNSMSNSFQDSMGDSDLSDVESDLSADEASLDSMDPNSLVDFNLGSPIDFFMSSGGTSLMNQYHHMHNHALSNSNNLQHHYSFHHQGNQQQRSNHDPSLMVNHNHYTNNTHNNTNHFFNSFTGFQ